MTEKTGLLIYDGSCSFCRSSARWLAPRWQRSARAVPWQQLDPGELAAHGLTLDDVGSSVWWIAPSSPPSGGAVAIARAMRAAHGWPAVAGEILLLPELRVIADRAYRLVARWRHHLPAHPCDVPNACVPPNGRRGEARLG